MKRREVLTNEERLWILRKRLNEDAVESPLWSPELRDFCMSLIDVVDGRMGTRSRTERERFVVVAVKPRGKASDE